MATDITNNPNLVKLPIHEQRATLVRLHKASDTNKPSFTAALHSIEQPHHNDRVGLQSLTHKWSLNEKTGKLLLELVNSQNGQTVESYPHEQLLKIAAAIKEILDNPDLKLQEQAEQPKG